MITKGLFLSNIKGAVSDNTELMRLIKLIIFFNAAI